MNTQTFRRPISRVIVDLLGPLVGSIAFLGVALALLIGLFDANPLIRVFGVFLFGLFGILMASGVLPGIRRGLNRAVLEVGPDGLWTPEMGRLAWSAIADVRIEQVRGFAGGDHESDSSLSVSVGDISISTDDFRKPEIPTTMYTRIGIVPADPSLVARERGRLGWRITSWMSRVSTSVNPASPAPDPSRLAPFGVYAYEIDGPLSAAVDAIREYRPVTHAP